MAVLRPGCFNVHEAGSWNPKDLRETMLTNVVDTFT
jgi:hypothetical protein